MHTYTHHTRTHTCTHSLHVNFAHQRALLHTPHAQHNIHTHTLALTPRAHACTHTTYTHVHSHHVFSCADTRTLVLHHLGCAPGHSRTCMLNIFTLTHAVHIDCMLNRFTLTNAVHIDCFIAYRSHSEAHRSVVAFIIDTNTERAQPPLER